MNNALKVARAFVTHIAGLSGVLAVSADCQIYMWDDAIFGAHDQAAASLINAAPVRGSTLNPWSEFRHFTLRRLCPNPRRVLLLFATAVENITSSAVALCELVYTVPAQLWHRIFVIVQGYTQGSQLVPSIAYASAAQIIYFFNNVVDIDPSTTPLATIIFHFGVQSVLRNRGQNAHAARNFRPGTPQLVNNEPQNPLHRLHHHHA